MKLFIILFVALSLSACGNSQNKETVIRQNETELPGGAIPVQFDGKEILYEYCANDSVKFKVIIDSGVESFLIDSAFIADNNTGIKERDDPKWVIGTIKSGFRLDDIRIYRTKVDRTSSPLLANERMMVWAVNFSKMSARSDTVKGLLPLKAFARNGIINVNLGKGYLLPLDSVNEQGYIKIPFKIIKNVPIVNTELLFSKNDETCRIKGNFMIDYGYVGSVGIKAATVATKPLNCKQENSQILDRVRDTVDVQLLGITMPNTPIQKSNIKVDNFTGVLGSSFLARFDVILDYKNNILYLKPNKYFEENIHNNNLRY